jgi:heme exporter protein A
MVCVEVTSMSALSIKDLCGGRGPERLFEGLDFAVGNSELVWLRGPNGSGKTTLLRMVAGLSEPESGSIAWDGVPVRKSTAFRSALVYIGHLNSMKDDLTAMESLRFLCHLHGREAVDADIESALRHMGVFHRRHLPAKALSQGQKRRASLARLVLERKPGLWVLDEPFDALDDNGVQTINSLLQGHIQRGGSALITSHISLKIEGVAIKEVMLEKVKIK